MPSMRKMNSKKLGPNLYFFEYSFPSSVIKISLTQIYETFFFPFYQTVHFGLRRGLPQKRLIDNTIIRLRETGLIQFHFQLRWTYKPNCDSFDRMVTKQVNFNYILGAYGVLFGGQIIACVLFLMENAMHKNY